MRVCLTVFMCALVVDYSLCLYKKSVKMPPEAASQLFLAVQQCMAETRVPLDAVMQVYLGGYSEDKKFKDFIYCCYQNIGYLKPDGSLNTEKSIELFKNEPDVVDGVRRCGKETGKNAKEALFNYFKCFQDTVPVRFTI